MDRNVVKRLGIAMLALCIVASPLFALAAGGLVPCDGPDCTFTSVIQLVNKIIDFLIKDIALPVSTILFAYAGFLYLTAAGDGGKITKAHGIFRNVFVGLILALAGWLVITLVTTVLTGKGIDELITG